MGVSRSIHVTIAVLPPQPPSQHRITVPTQQWWSTARLGPSTIEQGGETYLSDPSRHRVFEVSDQLAGLDLLLRQRLREVEHWRARDPGAIQKTDQLLGLEHEQEPLQEIIELLTMIQPRLLVREARVGRQLLSP